MLSPNNSAPDAKLENPVGDPENTLLRGSQLKYGLIWPRRFGSRGGCLRFFFSVGDDDRVGVCGSAPLVFAVELL